MFEVIFLDFFKTKEVGCNQKRFIICGLENDTITVLIHLFFYGNILKMILKLFLNILI